MEQLQPPALQVCQAEITEHRNTDPKKCAKNVKFNLLL